MIIDRLAKLCSVWHSLAVVKPETSHSGLNANADTRVNRFCLIFYLDETLEDSEGLGDQGYADLIPEIIESVEELIYRYQGRKLADVLRDIEQRYGISLPDDSDIRYRQYVAGLFDRELKTGPGAIEMLENTALHRFKRSVERTLAQHDRPGPIVWFQYL